MPFGHDPMAEAPDMGEPEGDEGGQENPRLQAIMELIKFLSHSEAKRAMPPKAAEAAPMDGAPGEDSLNDDDLEALKSFSR